PEEKAEHRLMDQMDRWHNNDHPLVQFGAHIFIDQLVELVDREQSLGNIPGAGRQVAKGGQLFRRLHMNLLQERHGHLLTKSVCRDMALRMIAVLPRWEREPSE